MSFKHWKPLIILFIILIGNVSLPSQSPAFVFNHLSVEDGLTAGEYNYYVHQDKYGMVWISSITGLNRFDGRHIKQYYPEPDNPHSLFDVHASQSRFYDDKEGNLWFSNRFGIVEYDQSNDRFNRYQIAYPISDTIKTDYLWMYLDSLNGELWINTIDRQFASNTNNISEVDFIGNFGISIKNRMYPTEDGAYYLFKSRHNTGKINLKYFKNRKESAPEKTFETPDNSNINDLCYLSDSLVWIATNTGLFQLNLLENAWKKVNNRFLIRTGFTEIEKRKNGSLILATLEDGLYFYYPENSSFSGPVLAFQQKKLVPFTPTIDRIYLDQSDNLWVSTAGDGIYYTNLNKPKFEPQLVDLAATHGSITDIFPGSKGDLWILVERGVFHFQESDTSFYSLPITGRGIERATFVHEDQTGRVWVGTLEYLFLLQDGDKSFIEVDILPEIRDNRPGYRSIAELPNGSLLFATNDSVCVQLAPDLSSSKWLEQSLLYPAFIEFINNQFVFIYGISNVLQIWSLKEEGITLEATLTDIPFMTGLVFDHSNNCYWISTLDGLLKITKQAKKEWRAEKDPIFTLRALSSLQMDNKGKLWIGTPNGLYAYLPGSKSINAYSITDGLPSQSFFNESSTILKNGNLIFGTNNGMIFFDPELIESKIPHSQPLITDIQINQEKDVSHLFSTTDTRNPAFIKQLQLPFKKNNIFLSLAALEYSNPEACNFKYQLLGSTDTSVVNHGNNTQLNFLNLSPGNYTLKVWASNSDGIWSKNHAQLAISILPPWYQTNWFYGALILAIGILFYAVYRYRIRELIRKQKLEQAASEAKRLAAETETAVLRLQMNPHFIFNSLNSIDAYILNDHKIKAHQFLIRFADLMRDILNKSERLYSSLDDEMALLQKYLDVEQMRIGDRMTYAFYADPAIDTYEAEIPTMILQPFIENAIWHGISPKKDTGHIQINFLENEAALICEVKDDGVGRGKSKNTKKHESKALKITERRLELLQIEGNAIKPSFSIIDEKDEAGHPAGTTVRFYFPKS